MEEQLSYDRLIAFHRQKENYQNSPPNTLSFAYGDFRYQKMTIELNTGDDLLKLKTLQELNKDFHRADLITLAILSSEILASLILHISNNNSQIRELSSRAIILVCQVKFAQDQIVKKNYVEQIMKLFDDHIKEIRHNAYQSMLNLSEYQQGIDHILEMGVLNPVVDKLVEENEEKILIQVLELLNRMLQGEKGQVDILRTQAIKRLTLLLEKPNSNIRKMAAQNLGSISFSERGKIEIINQGVVLHLVDRLNDQEDTVIEESSMALSSLAQRNEAKFQIINNNKLPQIIKQLDNSNIQIKLNIVQLIASMAEHPQGRKECIACLDTLNSIIRDPKYDFIEPYAKEAIQIILWKP